MWYWFFKFVVVHPGIALSYRPRWRGRENLPARGAFVLASNHTAYLETVLVPLGVPRKVLFVAKRKYYEKGGLGGRALAWFLTAIGQVPIDTATGETARPALDTAARILRDGGVWGVFPEGTRSPDGRLYRGHTGAMRVALATGAPVIPVAVVAARSAGPWWRWRSGRTRAQITYLPALDTSAWRDRADDPAAWREATDALMATIAKASGQAYVDRYPTHEERAARDAG